MSMALSQLHLSTSSIAEKTSAKDFQAVEARINHKFDAATNTQLEEIDRISITVLGYRGSTPVVKLPINLVKKVTELKEKLDANNSVRIAFEGLKIKPYALINDKGSLISGVSCSADDFTITQCDEDDLEGLEL
ncbi:hypothetical protein SAMN04487928_1244 [Butyrivibrio proteoclasticus]|uniref:Uncharacterized protein n=1 Tax=Butyrivibrio proteoclasticus TaxID=43305 RepID=A0A1I5WN83_9FIRM|nr:hypothetical protein [Butyrivibrio proteoclasticus]SFQ21272.1 hypothetical protein SAMN04487928_1244 [Butyrivibrio proteoclasticus]